MDSATLISPLDQIKACATSLVARCECHTCVLWLMLCNLIRGPTFWPNTTTLLKSHHTYFYDSTIHTYTHAHTTWIYMHTHMHTHARTHTHTHSHTHPPWINLHNSCQQWTKTEAWKEEREETKNALNAIHSFICPPSSPKDLLSSLSQSQPLHNYGLARADHLELIIPFSLFRGTTSVVSMIIIRADYYVLYTQNRTTAQGYSEQV